MNNARKQTITPAQAERIYGIPKGSLANMRCQRRGPRYFVPEGSRRVIYFVEDFEAWLRSGPVLTFEQQ